ncbi:MAG: glycosyltransferase family 39 protein [Chloroflexi bacterium]|nr:glycosyltransferase family 39 protein [Chloroflexota bacterium]
MTKQSSLFLTIVITLLAFGLRARDLGAASLWNDEGSTAFTIRQSWPEMVDRLWEDAVHPPLFFAAEKLLAGLGDSEFALRLPAVFFGVASVAAVARLGREWINGRAGLLAALFLAVSPFIVWYSREARMYSLLALLSIGVMAGFGRLLFSSPLRRALPAFAAISAVLYLTHYFALFLPLTQFAYLLVTFRQNHERLRRWALAQGLAALPIGLWIAGQYRHGVTLKIAWIPSPQWETLWLTFGRFINGTVPGWQFGVAVAIAVAGFGMYQLRLRQQSLLLALWWLLPPVLTFAISFRRPLYVDRYFIGSLCAFALALAAGVELIRRRTPWVGNALAALLVGLMGWQTLSTPNTFGEDWRGAAQYVTAHSRSGDILLSRSIFYWAFDYYYHGDLSLQAMDGDSQVEPPLQGRLWFVYRLESGGAASDKELLLQDLYRNAPDLERLEWLKAAEPYLAEWHDFENVTVLLYDFSLDTSLTQDSYETTYLR